MSTNQRKVELHSQYMTVYKIIVLYRLSPKGEQAAWKLMEDIGHELDVLNGYC